MNTEYEILQSTIFPDPEYPEEMFFQKKHHTSKYFLSTDTYFNRFAAHWWSEGSGESIFEVEIQCSKDVHVRLCGSGLNQENFEIEKTLVLRNETKIIQFNGEYKLGVWVEFHAQEHLEFEDIVINYRSKKQIDHFAGVNLVVCSYDKGSIVQGSINKIVLSSTPVMKKINQIYVIDQGNQDLNLIASEKITLISQPNLGGSGGFTRGLYESKHSGASGTILMDDDIQFIPEIILRIITYASFTNNTAPIRTQMLNLYHPDIVGVDTEVFDQLELWPLPTKGGRVNYHANSPFNLTTGQILTAWWCCYLPNEIVNKVGLPMPFFIHFDDTEYALRILQKIGLSANSIPGIGVWHEPFDSKSPWGWQTYFHIRNQLILASVLESKFRNVIKVVVKQMLVCLYSHRYLVLDASRRALKDFLDFEQNLYGNQRANIVLAKPNQISVNFEVLTMDWGILPARSRYYLFIKRCIISLLGTTRHGEKTVILSARHAQGPLPGRFNRALVIGNYGKIEEDLVYDRKLFLRGLGNLIVDTTELIFRYKRSARKWRKIAPDLYSDEAWIKQWS